MLTHLMLTGVLMVAQAQGSGTIEGVVREHGRADGPGLAFATLEVSAPGELRSAMADSLGAYRIEGLAAGLVRLRVSHLGYASARVDVEVPPGGMISLDVDLERRPIEMELLEVTGDPLAPPDVTPGVAPPRPEVEVIALAASPGLGEAGLGEAVAALPGNDPADPSDVLFMRGSTTDLKLVLLDGAPVYTPFHLGGLLSTFDAFALGAAALHTGGAPARYDGGLSYVLDLRTRRPRRDRLSGEAAVDLISGRLALEGPLGDRAAFAVSSRSLHDLGGAAFGGDRTPYGYRDVLGRIDVELGALHRIGATGFYNRESVLLSLDGNRTSAGPSPAGPEDARWGNQAVALAYRGTFGEIAMDVTGSASGYEAHLPLRPANSDQTGGTSGGTTSPDSVGFLAGAVTSRLRLALDASLPAGSSRIRFGGAIDGVRRQHSAVSFGGAPSAVEVASEARGLVGGAYVDGAKSVAPGFDVRLGLRADGFSTERKLRFAPRVAFLLSLGPDALLTLAAGRYHQYTRATDEDAELAVTDASPAALQGPLLTVATADHLVLSLDQQLSSRVRLGIEGFWKTFAGLGGPGANVLRNSGIDVQVFHEGPRATAWLGYNLAWFWSTPNTLDRTKNFAGRQLLSAGLTGSFAGRLEGALRVSYGSGLPYTSIPFGTGNATNAAEGPFTFGGEDPDDLRGDLAQEDPPFSGEPDDGFLRLDLELFTRFNPRIGGRDVQIRPYLRLINALDQRDALFYYFEPWRDDELRPLAQRRFLPVFGMEWRF